MGLQNPNNNICNLDQKKMDDTLVSPISDSCEQNKRSFVGDRGDMCQIRYSCCGFACPKPRTRYLWSPRGSITDLALHKPRVGSVSLVLAGPALSKYDGVKSAPELPQSHPAPQKAQLRALRITKQATDAGPTGIHVLSWTILTFLGSLSPEETDRPKTPAPAPPEN